MAKLNFLLITFIVLFSISYIEAQSQCRYWRNEYYLDCVACTQTCGKEPISCAAVCIPGCSCLPDWVKADGECVPFCPDN